jgi:hypothetical protein
MLPVAGCWLLVDLKLAFKPVFKPGTRNKQPVTLSERTFSIYI